MSWCSPILRQKMFLLFCCPLGLATAMIGFADRAGAHDRGDQVTQSAAEIQRTESFGQPYERGQGFSEDGYWYNQGPSMQGQYPRGIASQDQWDRYGDQFARQSDWGRGDSPAGLGVVLRETGDRGVQVVDVHRGSPAAEAGLEPDDQIIAINGRRTDSIRDLQSRVMQQNPGERVEIAVLRNGRQRTIDARLETRSQALNQQRQQARFQGDQSGRFSYEGDQFGRYQQAGMQDRQIQARLTSLERQLQQLLREVRTLQNVVDSQSSQMSGSPQPPRQAQRPDDRFWQDGGQQGRGPASDPYFEDSGRRNQFDF